MHFIVMQPPTLDPRPSDPPTSDTRSQTINSDWYSYFAYHPILLVYCQEKDRSPIAARDHDVVDHTLQVLLCKSNLFTPWRKTMLKKSLYSCKLNKRSCSHLLFRFIH